MCGQAEDGAYHAERDWIERPGRRSAHIFLDRPVWHSHGSNANNNPGCGEQYHHAHGERWQGRDFIRQRRDYRAQWSCHQNTIQFQLPADLRFCRLPRWKRRRRGAAEEWVHSFVGMVGQYHPKRHDPSRLWGPRLTLLHQTLSEEAFQQRSETGIGSHG